MALLELHLLEEQLSMRMEKLEVTGRERKQVEHIPTPKTR